MPQDTQETVAIDLTRFRYCAMAQMTEADVQNAVDRIIVDEDLEWMRIRLADAQAQQRLGTADCNCGQSPHGPRCYRSQAGAHRREELYREAIKRAEANQVQA